MSIDPNTLPEGTVVEIERCVFAIREDGQISSGFVGGVPFMPTKPITRVFVPVPDGMTYSDAVTALADAGAWVEVPDFPDVPMNARYRYERRKGLSKPKRYLVHCDDLPPTDPDAELVEKMARAAWETQEGGDWADVRDGMRRAGLNEARAALAVVREHEAAR